MLEELSPQKKRKNTETHFFGEVDMAPSRYITPVKQKRITVEDLEQDMTNETIEYDDFHQCLLRIVDMHRN